VSGVRNSAPGIRQARSVMAGHSMSTSARRLTGPRHRPLRLREAAEVTTGAGAEDSAATQPLRSSAGNATA
jgi:hypothetical protein